MVPGGEGAAGPRRLRQLLEAVVAVGVDLDLEAVLRRIVTAATELVDARYGALGVLDEAGTGLSEFITVGLDDDERDAIGPLPKGLGLLGHLIVDAEPLRLADLDEHPRRAGFPPGHPPMRSFLGVPIRVRGEVFGNLYITEKTTGEVFTDVDEELLVGLAAAAGVAIEHARLFEQAHRREATIDALGEVAASLLASTAADEVLQLIAGRARELVGADLATIALPEPGDELRIAIADGTGAEVLLGQRFARAGSPSGRVLDTAQALALDDGTTIDGGTQPILRLAGTGPVLIVPLVDGHPYGTLAVARLADGAPFGSGDIALLDSFARQVSVVLESEANRERLADLDRLEDQERIARDLHDSVIQRVFAASLSLQSAASLTGDERVRDRVERAIDELDTVTRLIRAVIFDIGARSPLGGDGVRRRVLDLTAESARVLGYAPDVLFDGPVDTVVSGDVAGELLPTLREALSNVTKHAAARSVQVRLTATGAGIRLEVRDDGAGLRSAGPVGGHGLANMRVRAEKLGGRCEIVGADGSGTVVVWSVPAPG